MARSGDWITPRLWNHPWFEKPPLVYWLAAGAHRLGLPEELAARLPVSALAVAFLGFFYLWVRACFSPSAAVWATGILASTAGWLAYAHVAVMDIPLSATTGIAMMLGFQAVTMRSLAAATLAGIALGLAILAKGLVAPVLLLPLFWFGRKQWRLLVSLLGWALLIAGPWYLICTWRHGTEFLQEFFWRHHMERFATESLHHVQPFWFYLPAFLALLLPWSPTLIALIQRNWLDSPVARFLGLWWLWGMLFFSVSRNKLPGYVLPLLPPMAALLGASVERCRHLSLLLALTAALAGLLPAAAELAPEAVVTGLSRAKLSTFPWPWVSLAVISALVTAYLTCLGRRQWAFSSILGTWLAGLVYTKLLVVARLDQYASARAIADQLRGTHQAVCVAELPRPLWYSLNYYVRSSVPACVARPAPLVVRQQNGKPPEVIPAQVVP